jgi:hypothetical protein
MPDMGCRCARVAPAESCASAEGASLRGGEPQAAVPFFSIGRAGQMPNAVGLVSCAPHLAPMALNQQRRRRAEVLGLCRGQPYRLYDSLDDRHLEKCGIAWGGRRVSCGARLKPSGSFCRCRARGTAAEGVRAAAATPGIAVAQPLCRGASRGKLAGGHLPPALPWPPRLGRV